MITIRNLRLKIDNQLLLENEDMDLYEGYIHVIMGESGSGKTTLLYEISLLSHLSDGIYLWNNQRIDQLDENQRAFIRKNDIGYILQDMELISEDLSLRENIECMFALRGLEYHEEKVHEYMKKLNLTCSLDQTVEQMSCGERQRFALVLALVKDVDFIVCDEPTSALDIDNIKELMHYLHDIARDYHKIIVIATHDHYVEEWADVLYQLKDKHLVKRVSADLLKQDSQYFLFQSHYPIKNKFYKIYKKSHKGIGQFLGNILYLIMIIALCIVPLILNDLIRRQESLYEMYASREIIVVNTQTSLPSITYNGSSQIFNEDQINLLKEINHVESVDYYWEMNGTLVQDNHMIDILVVPKEQIEQIEISSYLDNICFKGMSINIELELQGINYEFELTLDDYVVKEYPARTNTNAEVIYIPISMMKSLLQEQGISESSAVVVYVDEMDHIEETSQEIHRWFLGATLSSSGKQYADQLNNMKVMQQYMFILRIVLLVGTMALCFCIQTLENKARSKEINHLRINGFYQKAFYKLCLYENVFLVLCTIFCSLLGYVVIVLLLGLSFTWMNIAIICLQLIIYILITRIIPIVIAVMQIFRKDISLILRNHT